MVRSLYFALIAGSIVGLALGCGSASGNGAGAGGASTTDSATSVGGGFAVSTAIATTTFATTGDTATATATVSASASSASSSVSASASGSTTGSGPTSASSSGSSSSGPTVPPAGDCQDNSQCPSGQCVALTPGGYKVCLVPPTQATSCTGGSGDQCCPPNQMQCSNNAPCYQGPLVPYCGGSQGAPHNQCAYDQCAKDADCPQGQICTLTGTLDRKVRACIAAPCKVDADCVGSPGGECVPVREPCCSTFVGLLCKYPSNGGCRTDADCPTSASQPMRYCAPDVTNGVAVCKDGAPVCPQ